MRLADSPIILHQSNLGEPPQAPGTKEHIGRAEKNFLNNVISYHLSFNNTLKIGELISEFILKACLISAEDLLVAIIFARVLPKFKVK